MPKPALDTVAEVRRRLLRKGFARSYANRTAAELREHWEDLVDEAIRQGLNRQEAAAQANERLGESAALAEELSASMQSSSWFGRFPTLGFAWLVLTTTIVWWAVLLFALFAASGAISWNLQIQRDSKPNLDLVFAGIEWIRLGSYLAGPLVCCLVAQRYLCGWPGALWGCLIASIHGAAHYFNAKGESGSGIIEWGYSFSPAGPPLLPIFLPLAVFAAWTIWNRRDECNPGPIFS